MVARLIWTRADQTSGELLIRFLLHAKTQPVASGRILESASGRRERISATREGSSLIAQERAALAHSKVESRLNHRRPGDEFTK